MRESALDVDEGADMLMVKPGLPYLDVLARVADQFKMPVAVYQVSGEFAMLKAASANGWLDYRRCLMETLVAFRRAGASAILTYGALDAARWMRENSV
jgi:porphobilinogen synthase